MNRTKVRSSKKEKDSVLNQEGKRVKLEKMEEPVQIAMITRSSNYVHKIRSINEPSKHCRLLVKKSTMMMNPMTMQAIHLEARLQERNLRRKIDL